MFSLSFSFSFHHERVEYDYGTVQSHHQAEASVPRGKRRIEPTTYQRALPAPQSSAIITSGQQATPPPSAGSPYYVDTTYVSLSDQAQELQRQTRQRLRQRYPARADTFRLLSIPAPATTESAQREHAADAASLRLLETATSAKVAQRTLRERAADAASLRVLESVTAFKPKTKARRTETHKSIEPADQAPVNKHINKLLQSAGGDWSLISPPSSTALSRVHGLNGTPVSWEPSPDTVPSPHTPVSSTGYWREKHVFDEDSSEKKGVEETKRGKAETEDWHTPVQEAAPKLQDPIVSFLTTKTAASSAEKEMQVQEPPAHDHITDPFGSHLIEGSEAAELRLQQATQEYRRQQADSVHKLFDQLAERDGAQTMGDLPSANRESGSMGFAGAWSKTNDVPSASTPMSIPAAWGKAQPATPVASSESEEGNSSSSDGVVEASPCVRLSLRLSNTRSGGSNESMSSPSKKTSSPKGETASNLVSGKHPDGSTRADAAVEKASKQENRNAESDAGIVSQGMPVSSLAMPASDESGTNLAVQTACKTSRQDEHVSVPDGRMTPLASPTSSPKMLASPDRSVSHPNNFNDVVSAVDEGSEQHEHIPNVDAGLASPSMSTQAQDMLTSAEGGGVSFASLTDKASTGGESPGRKKHENMDGNKPGDKNAGCGSDGTYDRVAGGDSAESGHGEGHMNMKGIVDSQAEALSDSAESVQSEDEGMLSEDEDEDEDEHIVMEGLPKMQPEAVEDDWMLI